MLRVTCIACHASRVVCRASIQGVHRFDLWDDQPGSDWTTSYMLGNGHLGAILGMGTAQVQ